MRIFCKRFSQNPIAMMVLNLQHLHILLPIPFPSYHWMTASQESIKFTQESYCRDAVHDHNILKRTLSLRSITNWTSPAFWPLRKVHLIWQGGGGWRYWNSKLEILAASPPPPASSSIFQEPPHPPVGFEEYKFLEAPPLIFSEPPSRVSKNFRRPPSISSSPLSY